MGCTKCKQKNGSSEPITSIKNNTVINYIIKILFFILTLTLIPLIIIVLIAVLFNVIVLSKRVDILPMLMYIGDKIFNNDKDTDDDIVDYDEEYEIEDDILVLK